MRRTVIGYSTEKRHPPSYLTSDDASRVANDDLRSRDRRGAEHRCRERASELPEAAGVDMSGNLYHRNVDNLVSKRGGATERRRLTGRGAGERRRLRQVGGPAKDGAADGCALRQAIIAQARERHAEAAAQGAVEIRPAGCRGRHVSSGCISRRSRHAGAAGTASPTRSGTGGVFRLVLQRQEGDRHHGHLGLRQSGR